MAFDSFSAFVVMEGHGPYVWTCYGVFFLLMIGLMVGSIRRRRAVLDLCRRGYQRQSADAADPGRGPAAASFTRVKVSQD